MYQTEKPGNKVPGTPNLVTTPMVIGAQVGCVTLIIVFLSIFIGLWLDRTFNTKPAFILIFTLGSAPISLVLTFWLAKRAINRIQSPLDLGQSVKKSQPYEEDDGE
jgi:F0F1-type ATP synthase assembly protein I